MNNVLVDVDNIYKVFGRMKNRVEVIKKLSFKVYEGEFVSIMGPSGCGKSTLLYLISALLSPERGRIRVLGNDLFKMSDSKLSEYRRNKIGFIFQFYNLVPNLTVEENILVPIIMDKKSTRDYQDKLKEILQIVKLEGKRKKYPNELSGGEQQRVAIARALIIEPKLILADEPTGNLDKQNGIEIMKLFRTINNNYGVSIIQVTHNLETAQYGNRIIEMSDGKIINDKKI